MYIFDRQNNKVNVYELIPNEERVKEFKKRELKTLEETVYRCFDAEMTFTAYHYFDRLGNVFNRKHSDYVKVTNNPQKREIAERQYLSGAYDREKPLKIATGEPKETLLPKGIYTIQSSQLGEGKNCSYKFLLLKITEKQYYYHLILNYEIEKIIEGLSGLSKEGLQEVLSLFDFMFVTELDMNTLEQMSELGYITKDTIQLINNSTELLSKTEFGKKHTKKPTQE